MKKILFLTLVIALFAVSCKNKKTAKTLEGTWNEVSVNGTAIPVLAQDQIVFGACKGGKKKKCDLTIIDDGGTTFNYDYTIVDAGETLVIKTSVGIFSANTNNTISSLTDNSMTIEWSDLGGGYTGTYEKQ